MSRHQPAGAVRDLADGAAGGAGAGLDRASEAVSAAFKDVACRPHASLQRNAGVMNALPDCVADAAETLARPPLTGVGQKAGHANRSHQAETPRAAILKTNGAERSDRRLLLSFEPCALSTKQENFGSVMASAGNHGAARKTRRRHRISHDCLGLGGTRFLASGGWRTRESVLCRGIGGLYGLAFQRLSRCRAPRLRGRLPLILALIDGAGEGKTGDAPPGRALEPK